MHKQDVVIAYFCRWGAAVTSIKGTIKTLLQHWLQWHAISELSVANEQESD